MIWYKMQCMLCNFFKIYDMHFESFNMMENERKVFTFFFIDSPVDYLVLYDLLYYQH